MSASTLWTYFGTILIKSKFLQTILQFWVFSSGSPVRCFKPNPFSINICSDPRLSFPFQVSDAVSALHLPLPPQGLPPPLPPPHYLWPLWFGPQTRVPLLPVLAEKVAPRSHSPLGLSQGPAEAATEPDPALPGRPRWPAEEPPPGRSLCRQAANKTRRAKSCSGWSGRGRTERWRENSRVCGEVRPACFKPSDLKHTTLSCLCSCIIFEAWI